MSEPEIKMEKFDEIQQLVKKRRDNEIEQNNLHKRLLRINEALADLGISCNNVTNCSMVGKLCFKCKNNYSRRNYFRDLLAKDTDLTCYGLADSCFVGE